MEYLLESDGMDDNLQRQVIDAQSVSVINSFSV